MILCCTTCGNSFYSENKNEKCNYCFNDTEVLITDDELKGLSDDEIPVISKTLKEKYKSNNSNYNKDIWSARESKDHAVTLNDELNQYNNNFSNHKIHISHKWKCSFRNWLIYGI